MFKLHFSHKRIDFSVRVVVLSFFLLFYRWAVKNSQEQEWNRHLSLFLLPLLAVML